MISVEEASRRLLDGIAPVGRRETVDLRQALDRILADDLLATRTQPPFDASAMDGYAVRASNLGHVLRVIGESAAGFAFDGAVSAGEAVRIFTGAPVPIGADAILIQENAERLDEGSIRARGPVEAGCHIRRAGMDFSKGEVLLKAGARLDPGAIALAASGGYPHLAAIDRPKVAVAATGSELVRPGETVGPSRIVASNSFGVMALVERAGGRALDYGIAPDDEAAVGALIDRAVEEEADVLVTIGGASVGDHDLVQDVFKTKGVTLDFWKIAMRPGKPFMAGRRQAMRVVGLPGNPASAMVCATLFLAPLVKGLAGRPARALYRKGVLAADMPPNAERADFVRATIVLLNDGTVALTPLERQDSSLLSIYAKADALLLRPPHAPKARKGEPCLYVPIG